MKESLKTFAACLAVMYAVLFFGGWILLDVQGRPYAVAAALAFLVAAVPRGFLEAIPIGVGTARAGLFPPAFADFS